jgi:hypothetical protein
LHSLGKKLLTSVSEEKDARCVTDLDSEIFGASEETADIDTSEDSENGRKTLERNTQC